MKALHAVLFAAVITATVAGMGQLAEHPTINATNHPAVAYDKQPTADLVADLKRRIEDGTAEIPFDEATGYLRPTVAPPL